MCSRLLPKKLYFFRSSSFLYFVQPYNYDVEIKFVSTFSNITDKHVLCALLSPQHNSAQITGG